MAPTPISFWFCTNIKKPRSFSLLSGIILAESIGVPCLYDFSLSYLEEITEWIEHPVSIKLEYKNELSTLVDEISIAYIKHSLLNNKSSATANS